MVGGGEVLVIVSREVLFVVKAWLLEIPTTTPVRSELSFTPTITPVEVSYNGRLFEIFILFIHSIIMHSIDARIYTNHLINSRN